MSSYKLVKERKEFFTTLTEALKNINHTAFPYRGRGNRLSSHVVGVRLRDIQLEDSIDSHNFIINLVEELAETRPLLVASYWLGKVSVDNEPTGCKIVYFTDVKWYL